MGATTIQGVRVRWADHATVQLQNSIKIYIDPFKDAMEGEYEKADLVIATHPHFDHFDPEAINRLVKEDSTVFAKEGCNIGKIRCEALFMNPGDQKEMHGVTITGVEAYNDHRFRNPGEPFHPPGVGMGVIVDIDGARFYHAGDTDHIDEMEALSEEEIDVALLPIGGTYTMDVEEAIEAAKDIQPSIVIPIHYNMIERTEADPYRFKRELERDTDIHVEVLDPDT